MRSTTPGLVATQKEAERAFLVGVAVGRDRSGWTVESSLAELSRLARTAGAEVVGTMVQRLERPSPAYLGKGKLEALLAEKEQADYT
ncbi:MAG: GTPase HflX, partial [Chloroflexi bacterium]|nr:GTPase HflX [Chloroflexota bacterium]